MNAKPDDTLARKRTRARKADSRDSTCSAEKEILKSPKDALALGRTIVRQLELEDRGTVLERWLAHHLAEVIAEADQAVGVAKAASEAQASVAYVDLAAWGIPDERELVDAYCRFAGRGAIDNWPFYIVYNLFRSAGIIQGVYKRGIDGNASSEKALQYAGVARARAERGWELVQSAAG